MWIKQTTFVDVLRERSEAVGKAAALEAQVVALNTTADWFRVRLTQLEHERAQLIFNYMGVKITTPVFEPTQPTKGAEAISDIPSFQDVGDEKAKELGLDWDADGRVTQHGKAIE